MDPAVLRGNPLLLSCPNSNVSSQSRVPGAGLEVSAWRYIQRLEAEVAELTQQHDAACQLLYRAVWVQDAAALVLAEANERREFDEAEAAARVDLLSLHARRLTVPTAVLWRLEFLTERVEELTTRLAHEPTASEKGTQTEEHGSEPSSPTPPSTLLQEQQQQESEQEEVSVSTSKQMSDSMALQMLTSRALAVVASIIAEYVFCADQMRIMAEHELSMLLLVRQSYEKKQWSFLMDRKELEIRRLEDEVERLQAQNSTQEHAVERVTSTTNSRPSLSELYRRFADPFIPPVLRATKKVKPESIQKLRKDAIQVGARPAVFMPEAASIAPAAAVNTASSAVPTSEFVPVSKTVSAGINSSEAVLHRSSSSFSSPSTQKQTTPALTEVKRVNTTLVDADTISTPRTNVSSSIRKAPEVSSKITQGTTATAVAGTGGSTNGNDGAHATSFNVTSTPTRAPASSTINTTTTTINTSTTTKKGVNITESPSAAPVLPRIERPSSAIRTFKRDISSSSLSSSSSSTKVMLKARDNSTGKTTMNTKGKVEDVVLSSSKLATRSPSANRSNSLPSSRAYSRSYSNVKENTKPVVTNNSFDESSDTQPKSRLSTKVVISTSAREKKNVRNNTSSTSSSSSEGNDSSFHVKRVSLAQQVRKDNLDSSSSASSISLTLEGSTNKKRQNPNELSVTSTTATKSTPSLDREKVTWKSNTGKNEKKNNSEERSSNTLMEIKKLSFSRR
ncbi:hypothetical protein LSM04_000635 [Trypanosoma melophagium]|uniref:uncharacterized protein n=1 Tax=Trypanosoma melophagium TaxID=715481 RepID=UPI00351A1CC9|nr:hypothetical protein LSM04_000635 [Trypanosoma melophagium]